MSTIASRPPEPVDPSTPKNSHPAAEARGALRRAFPTALAIAALAGLAYWGHRSEWTRPTFASLTGSAHPEVDAWCVDHGVPEAQCIECRPELAPAQPDYGWCQEHGVPQCPLHHPQVAQLKKAAVVLPAHLDRAQRALETTPRAVNNSRCKLQARRIQFASAAAMEKAGVDIALVDERPIVEAIEANGEVVYDETHTAHLVSRAPGTAWRVERQVGDRVARGDVLALIDAADVGRAKAELLQASALARLRRATFERLRPLSEQGAVPGRQLLDAESALQEADIRLLGAQQALVNLGLPVDLDELAEGDPQALARQIRLLGLPTELQSQFDASTTTSNLLPIRAPLDGTVIARDIVAGELVDAERTIFVVADVSRMWLTLNVRHDQAEHVRIGQRVLFQPSHRAAAEIQGAVAWISTEVDDETRTVEVRVDLPNDDGSLRANTFGAGRIVLREEPQAIVVPSEAVHWDGCCQVVFVRDKNFLQPNAPKFFHVRKVRTGAQQGDVTEVIAGLLPGEVIASKNSRVLGAQLLKSNLGAGCCEVHGAKK